TGVPTRAPQCGDAPEWECPSLGMWRNSMTLNRLHVRTSMLLTAVMMVTAACTTAAPTAAPQPTQPPAAAEATATTAPAAEATKAEEAATSAPAQGGAVKDVPREKTLIVTTWYFGNQLQGFDNYNIYMNGGAQRDLGGNKGIYENLMYTNMNT